MSQKRISKAKQTSTMKLGSSSSKSKKLSAQNPLYNVYGMPTVITNNFFETKNKFKQSSKPVSRASPISSGIQTPKTYRQSKKTLLSRLNYFRTQQASQGSDRTPKAQKISLLKFSPIPKKRDKEQDDSLLGILKKLNRHYN